MDSQLALVTGGTGGIGTQICTDFARRGFQVVAIELPELEQQTQAWQLNLKQQYNVDVAIEFADVSNFESCQSMAERVRSQFGDTSILVNAAGITRDSTLVKMEATQWDEVMRSNLDSIFNVTRQFIEPMVANGYGRIVNISSVNGGRGQFGQTNYCAAKAGVHGFTKALAQETAAKGVTVNTVSPGYVATPMVEKIREDILQSLVDKIPLKRLAKPEEIAHVVAFLVDDASAYITGANIDINGGLWMH